MSETKKTRFCYHCRLHHPEEEMRLLVTKTGSRWRCIKSIEATKISQAEREAYGKRVTAANSAEAAGKLRITRAKDKTF